MPRNVSVTHEMVLSIREDYFKMTMQELATTYGLHIATVRRHVSDLPRRVKKKLINVEETLLLHRL